MKHLTWWFRLSLVPVWCTACGLVRGRPPSGPEAAGCARTDVIGVAEQAEDLTVVRDSLISLKLLPRTDPARLVFGGPTPTVANQAEMKRLNDRYFPRSLRKSGGIRFVRVSALVDVDGRVTRARASRTSGSAEVDRAGLRLVEGMVFTPARYEDCRVRARIAVTFTFNG